MRIIAKIRAMAEAEVLGLVPDRIIRDIKREDPRPLFKAFVVSHEGVATPTMIGIGKTIQRWFGNAVKALAMKLRIGTKVFNGHEEDNSHDQRQSVGEVIGKTVETINGFLSAVAVTYIYPKFKDLTFDVASIEADLMIPSDVKEFEVQEPDVLAVTGIALGDSKIDKPAFPGATLQAALQAFAEIPPKGEKTMTLEEIKNAVRESKFKPSEVFRPQEIISDPVVQDRIEDMKDSVKSAGLRKNAEYEEKILTLETENKDLQGQVGEFSKQSLVIKGRDVFTEILKERKLDGDEKFNRYVKKVYEKSFTPTEEDKLKTDLNTFVDGQVDEYKDIFGEAVKVGAATGDGGNGPANKGVGADNKGTAGGDLDLLDPANNDLIPQD